MSAILSHRLSDLPNYGKLFVGLFTALMLLVCLWAVLILYVEEGMVGEDDELPAYLTIDATADSATMAHELQERNSIAREKQEADLTPEEFYEQLEHNVGLAHTHINGQTLLFFAIGLIFLFTSAAPKIKMVTLSIFAAAIVLHMIGLTGHHFGWFYDDILSISGVVILVVILYICFLIFAELCKNSSGGSD